MRAQQSAGRFTGAKSLLPTLHRDLHLSATGVQWVVNAYGLPLAT